MPAPSGVKETWQIPKKLAMNKAHKGGNATGIHSRHILIPPPPFSSLAPFPKKDAGEKIGREGKKETCSSFFPSGRLALTAAK